MKWNETLTTVVKPQFRDFLWCNCNCFPPIPMISEAVLYVGILKKHSNSISRIMYFRIMNRNIFLIFDVKRFTEMKLCSCRNVKLKVKYEMKYNFAWKNSLLRASANRSNKNVSLMSRRYNILPGDPYPFSEIFRDNNSYARINLTIQFRRQVSFSRGSRKRRGHNRREISAPRRTTSPFICL